MVLALVAATLLGASWSVPHVGRGRAAASRPPQAFTSSAPRALFPAPRNLVAFGGTPSVGEGRWRPAGRPVRGHAAIYTTTLGVPSDSRVVAGIAWMDIALLRAKLYSGSLSPGGFFWKRTAPISPLASRTLVAAFNGGFLLKDSHGGYLSEGHLVAPLRVGAASLVIYRNGSVRIGQWGRDVAMTPSVVAVRQNLNLLVDHARPVAGLRANDVATWGYALNNNATTWRSGVGQTANGALVYVAGPMTIVDLARVLVRAGALRAMVLDMNPLWTIFASYAPARANAPASAPNGTDLVPTMVQRPGRFFETAYSRDFVALFAN